MLDCLRMPGAVATMVLLVLALVVLAWPAARARAVPFEQKGVAA